MNNSPLNNIKMFAYKHKQSKEEGIFVPYSRIPTNKHRNNKIRKSSPQNFQKNRFKKESFKIAKSIGWKVEREQNIT